jgi:fructose/tagatose bisphosphate aldolase
MLVGSVRRILHDANVHRLSNRYSNRFSCVIIDEARRTFEENIARVLEDIELAKRLQRVAAAALHLDGELIDAIPSI